MKNSVRFLVALLAFTTLSGTHFVGVGAVSSISAQVTPIDDEPDDAPGLGSIVGSPDAGPKPEDAGDRGGYAQLGLALVMLGAVVFIGSRIVRESRSNRSNMSPNESL